VPVGSSERTQESSTDYHPQARSSSRDCETRRGDLSEAVASLVVAVPCVTRQVTGRRVRAFLSTHARRAGFDVDAARIRRVGRAKTTMSANAHTALSGTSVDVRAECRSVAGLRRLCAAISRYSALRAADRSRACERSGDGDGRGD